MTGRRLPDGDIHEATLAPGDYMYDPQHQVWWIRPPRGRMGHLTTGPDGWTITEHEDRTITAAPSIDNDLHSPERWHGYLERGVWREV